MEIHSDLEMIGVRGGALAANLPQRFAYRFDVVFSGSQMMRSWGSASEPGAFDHDLEARGRVDAGGLRQVVSKAADVHNDQELMHALNPFLDRTRRAGCARSTPPRI